MNIVIVAGFGAESGTAAFDADRAKLSFGRLCFAESALGANLNICAIADKPFR